MQHVYTARDEMDAHFVKGLLEQEGIEARVLGESLGGAFGTLPLSARSLPGVYVRDEDVARATPIVDEYRRIDVANADDLTDEPADDQPPVL
jgi:hypothetical protein